MVKERREKRVKKYKDEFGISFPILLDERGEVDDAYRIWGHPSTFFINREGKIIGRAFGGRDWTSKSIRDLINQILEEKT